MPRKKRFQTEAQSLTLNDRFEGWGKEAAERLKGVEIPSYKIPLNLNNSTKISFKQHNYVTQINESIFQHNKDKFKSTADVYRNAHIWGTVIQFYLYILGGQNGYEKQLYKVFKEMEEELSYSKIYEMAQERIKILVNNVTMKILEEDDILGKISGIIESCPIKIQQPLEEFTKELIYQSRQKDLYQSYNLSKRHLKPI
jgi:hypothetical protein